MKNYSLNSEKAADIFLEWIKHNVYDSVIQSVNGLLIQGPPGRKKDHNQAELSKWFQDLDEYNRKIVLEVVEASVQLSVFSFLVVLDNKIAGSLLGDQLSDIDLRISTYENDDSKFSYSPQHSIRVNLSYDIDGDLHDMWEETLHK